MAVVEPLERRSLVDLLTAKLREEILSGRYKKGATLPPERELAESLRVNRTSLKHALMRLEQLGLIAIRHGIGSVVLDTTETAGAELIAHLVFRERGIDGKMLGDLVEARTLLGGFLARLAAERCQPEDLDRLNALVDGLADESLSLADVQRLELEFFRASLMATNNKVFALLANSVFLVYRSRAALFQGAFADRVFVHESVKHIRDAIESGDGAGAERAALDYLRENGRRLVDAAVDRIGGAAPTRARGKDAPGADATSGHAPRGRSTAARRAAVSRRRRNN